MKSMRRIAKEWLKKVESGLNGVTHYHASYQLFSVPTLTIDRNDNRILDENLKDRASAPRLVLCRHGRNHAHCSQRKETQPQENAAAWRECSISSNTPITFSWTEILVHQCIQRSRRATLQKMFSIFQLEASSPYWSGSSGSSAKRNRWFDVIRRKDESMMAKQLISESRMGSMLTTPLGLVMRMGPFTASSLIHVCDRLACVVCIH